MLTRALPKSTNCPSNTSPNKEVIPNQVQLKIRDFSGQKFINLTQKSANGTFKTRVNMINVMLSAKTVDFNRYWNACRPPADRFPSYNWRLMYINYMIKISDLLNGIWVVVSHANCELRYIWLVHRARLTSPKTSDIISSSAGRPSILLSYLTQSNTLF